MTRFVIPLALLTLAGCGGEPPRRSEPVPVSGKVTHADGKPVKDVTLTLQPTGDGLPAALSVSGDGSLKGQVIPGDYVYSFTALEGKGGQKNTAGLKAVPEKYRAPHLDHKVQVGGGGNVEIKLDAK